MLYLKYSTELEVGKARLTQSATTDPKSNFYSKTI